MSALTGWGTATRWTICWRSSPARKNICPASKPSRRPLRRRSICWWTSRQNSRPEKVPGTPAGPRCSTSSRWHRPLNYLSEHGLLDYADLETKTAEATARYNALSDQIKAAEKRMAEIAVLRTHIVNYAKTRETYVAYRKAGYSKKFRQEHEEEILLHQAAKEAFNELNVKKLPTIKELQTEYAQLLADKKKAYGEYRQARATMRELLTVKNNVDRVLAMEQTEPQQKEKDHGQR